MWGISAARRAISKAPPVELECTLEKKITGLNFENLPRMMSKGSDNSTIMVGRTQLSLRVTYAVTGKSHLAGKFRLACGICRS